MTELYIPRRKIAIASSFEGIVNNGATECGLTSFNAYQAMPEGGGKFYGRLVNAADFSSIRSTKEMEAFLLLRPVVEVAEDYITVIELIEKYPELIDNMLANPDSEMSYRPLLEKFEERKAESADLRARFKKAFYDERQRLQAADMNAWNLTQEPYMDTLPQFRRMLRGQVRNSDAGNAYEAIVSGLVPWFATSKDGASTYWLCKLYADVKKLEEGDVDEDGRRVCIISRDRIISKDQTTNKVKQMEYIAEKEGIERLHVWRLNDRYDAKQQTELRDAGFPVQFLLPGYVFPFDLKKAEKDDTLVMILDRKRFAEQLEAYAERNELMARTA